MRPPCPSPPSAPHTQGPFFRWVINAHLSRKPLLAALMQHVVIPAVRGDALVAVISVIAPLLFEALMAPTPSLTHEWTWASPGLPHRLSAQLLL